MRTPMHWLVIHTTRSGTFLCGNARTVGDDVVVTAVGGETASAPAGRDVMGQAQMLLLEIYGAKLAQPRE